MSDFDYLEAELVADGAPSWDVAAWVDATARGLLEAAVDPAVLELTSEHLARAAAALGDGRLDAASVRAGLAHLELPPALCELLEHALARPRAAAELAALAVHLVDVAERLALLVFLPELPSLIAKSDRTGGAARNVGVARHLKG